MTRINVVPVKELSDQHLIAEYRELPRVIKQQINIDGAPENYVLGTGHVKWARTHIWFVMDRYAELCKEMKYRGFTVNNPATALIEVMWIKTDIGLRRNYKVKRADLKLNRERLKERGNNCTWAKRHKPLYMCNNIWEWLHERLG